MFFGFLSVACVPKKRRSDDSPSQMSNQGHNSVPSKPRGHVPMSERQQFALLRQMETEEVNQERGLFVHLRPVFLCSRTFYPPVW